MTFVSRASPLRSQRIQDQIQQWVRTGRWDCVVQEKRNVLVCMQQVLQSCHTLLDSTQIPVDGVVRLLQHILRYAGMIRRYSSRRENEQCISRVQGL